LAWRAPLVPGVKLNQWRSMVSLVSMWGKRRRSRSSSNSNNSRSSSSSSSSSSSNNEPPERDPITLEELGPASQVFCFGKARYNALSLHTCLVASADFRCPVQRIEIPEAELARLDKLVGRQGPSVLAAKRAAGAQASARFERDALEALERFAGELVCEMMEAVEGGDSRPVRLIASSTFPEFHHVVSQMAASSPLGREAARQVVEHAIAFLKGPPTRPTRCTSGLLPVCISFLSEELLLAVRSPVTPGAPVDYKDEDGGLAAALGHAVV
jgi:hypothetical protein